MCLIPQHSVWQRGGFLSFLTAPCRRCCAGFSLVAVSGGCSLVACAGFCLCSFSCCGPQALWHVASVVVSEGLVVRFLGSRAQAQ